MNVCFSRCRQRSAGGPSAGFTLIEVLMVLVILVILGSIAVPMYQNVIVGARINAAKAQVQMFEGAIDLYQTTTTRLPSNLGDLIQPPNDASVVQVWSGPYLKNKTLIDPWEDPYQYTAQGIKNQDSYDVWSLGPDRQNATNDDIGNWGG